MASWGMGWFGGSGAAAAGKKKNSPKDAILLLREQADMLGKREAHLQTKMDEQTTIARRNAQGNPGVAKAALRRKKQLEKSLEQTSSQIMTVEGQISSIETANINKGTLDAMTKANQAMKQIHNGLTIEKVDQITEDLREQHAISEEISDALNQQSTNALDEDDLDEELAELQQEELDNKMLKSGTVPADQLPSAPTAVKGKAVQEDDEEEELRKLQAEMAM